MVAGSASVMNAKKLNLALHIHLMGIMLNAAHVEALGLLQLTLLTQPADTAKEKVDASVTLVKERHSERHTLRMDIIADAVRVMDQARQMLDTCQIAKMPNKANPDDARSSRG